MLECNYLEMLVKPNYEKPVDTAQDILERGLTILWPPGLEYYKEMLKTDKSQVFRDLAERVSVSKVSKKLS